ncbi:MAG: hypothetical protein ACYDCI_06730 [Candidatus Limnocylindrales bacterium]
MTDPRGTAIRRDLDDLIASLPKLGPVEYTRLHAFWSGIEPAERAAAHERAQAAATAADRRALIQGIQRTILDWGGEQQSRGTTGWGEQWVDPDPDEKRGGSARSAAVPAIVDAALALALRDVLAAADFDVLFDPWLDAVGEDDPDRPGVADRSDGSDDVADGSDVVGAPGDAPT